MFVHEAKWKKAGTNHYLRIFK